MADPKQVLLQIKARLKETVKQVGKAANVLQLDLSEIQIGKFTPEIKKTIESYSNIEAASFAECDLSSLQHFPTLKKLQQLDVSSNSLTDVDLKIIASNCKELTRLSIGDNSIQKLQSLKILKNLPLQSLDCDDNPISKDSKYTKTAFEVFKTLKYLDNKDKDGNEMIEDQEMNGDEEGQDDKLDQDESDQEGVQGQEEGEDDDDQDQEAGQAEQKQQSSSEQKPKKKKRSS